MNKPRFLLNAGLLLGFHLSGLSGLSLTASAVEAAAVPDKPLNLARSSYGARLMVRAPASVKENTTPRAAQALLTDDDPLGYELAAGTTDVLLALPRAEVVNRLNFLNLNAAGRVSVAVSDAQLPADSPRWRTVCPAQGFAGENEVISCELGGAEAKYLKITLEVPAAGRIDTLGLFGQTTVASAARQPAASAGNPRLIGYETFSYGNIAAQSRIVRVSSGSGPEAAESMIDGNLNTNYAFSPSDRRPVTVVDLGTNRALTRISVAYKSGVGRLDFYLLPDPAQRGGLLRTSAASAPAEAPVSLAEMTGAGFPGDRTPAASINAEGRPGLTRSTVALNGESGRYLAVVFTPRGGSPRAQVDVKDYKDYKDYRESKDGVATAPAGASDGPLDISEVIAYGPPSGLNTAFSQLPPGGTSSGTPFFPVPDPGIVIEEPITP